MNFGELTEIFEKLGSTSKRLEKTLILRDFYLKNPKEVPIIFDLIAGNYQRKIDKRSIGISLKTVFSVISFISRKTEREVESYFNKIGDVGSVASEFLKGGKQSSFTSKGLTLKEILIAYENISRFSGNNKNKFKKEILGNLFLSCESEVEYKFLARLLIDDLRIGVSEGVLRESVVNSLFTQIIGINLICSKCSYSNLNLKNCLNCGEVLEEKIQEELVSKKYKVLEVDTPEEFIGLDEFIGKVDEEERLKFILRSKRSEHFIKSNSPRNLYNLFLELFEKKYNVLNSFVDAINDIKDDLTRVIKCEIELGRPIKSMLGTRSNTIDDSFSVSGKPALLDFKYDGLRVQIHNDKGSVRLFSRNLDEITKQFPEVVDFIKENFSDVRFIVDSECVGFDFDKGVFLPFQMLSRRILSKDFDNVSHIKVVVKAFDLLYFGSDTLIDYDYSERRDMLDELFVGRELKQELNFSIEKIK